MKTMLVRRAISFRRALLCQRSRSWFSDSRGSRTLQCSPNTYLKSLRQEEKSRVERAAKRLGIPRSSLYQSSSGIAWGCPNSRTRVWDLDNRFSNSSLVDNN